MEKDPRDSIIYKMILKQREELERQVGKDVQFIKDLQDFDFTPHRRAEKVAEHLKEIQELVRAQGREIRSYRGEIDCPRQKECPAYEDGDCTVLQDAECKMEKGGDLMSTWETTGKTDEWYTPKYIFDALEERYDLDVAHPNKEMHVPCTSYITEGSLLKEWSGFIWMNPPFGGRNGIVKWLNKFFIHGHGIALAPDRTSAPWWQDACKKSDGVLFISGKVKFVNESGETGNSPSNGTVLFAAGDRAVAALQIAESNGLGLYLSKGEVI